MGALSASGNGSKTTIKDSFGYDMTKNRNSLQNSGRSLKSDVRSSVRCPMSVRRFCDFCDICLYSLNMALHGTPLLLTEENQLLIFEPSSFFIQTGILYRLFFSFFQKLQKSPRVVSGGKMRKSEQVNLV